MRCNQLAPECMTDLCEVEDDSPVLCLHVVHKPVILYLDTHIGVGNEEELWL